MYITLPEILIVTIFMLASFCAGIWSARSRGRQKQSVAGTLVINTTDVNKDVIRIELGIPIAEMMNATEVTFTVIREDES